MQLSDRSFGLPDFNMATIFIPLNSVGGLPEAILLEKNLDIH